MAFGDPVESTYWAGQSGPALARECYRRVSELERTFSDSGHRARIRKAISYYYGESANATSYATTPAGERGELTTVWVNWLRLLVQHTVSLVSGQRLAFLVTPKNSDAASREQAVLCEGLLAGYVKDLRLDRTFRRATEYSLVCSEAYVRVDWDYDAGEDYTVDEQTGKPLKTGDLKVSLYPFTDVIRDETRMDPEAQWYILIDYVNRYDLMAKYPEQANAIRSATWDWPNSFRTNPFQSRLVSREDLIPVYTFLHDRSPAVPDGAYCHFLNGDTVLTDGPLPHATMQVFRMAPADVINTPRGYTPVFDQLGPMEAYNALLSTSLSNQMAFGVQNIVSKRGNGIKANDLVGGLNFIEYNDERPEALQLTSTPAEVFTSQAMYKELMIALAGHNQTSLGMVDQRLSGSAMALLDSKSLQFSQPCQESYTFLAEGVALACIHTLRRYATVPRVKLLVGKTNRFMMKEFVGSDLEGIERISVGLGNPVARTPAMRQDTADKLLQSGAIRSSEEYFEVQTLGTLSSRLQGAQTESLLIQRENENLSQGRAVPVVLTDNHRLHISEHKAVLADPDVRMDPSGAGVQAALEHLNEHMNQRRILLATQPDLLAIIEQGPSAAAPPVPPAGINPGDNMPPGEPPQGPANMPRMPVPPPAPQG